MDIIKNYLVSVIRTAVPSIIGLITGWLATRNITLDNESLRLLTMVVEGLAGMLYYVVVRLLEHVNYRFGWLLGYAKMPVYIVTPTVPATAYQSSTGPAPIAPGTDPMADVRL